MAHEAFTLLERTEMAMKLKLKLIVMMLLSFVTSIAFGIPISPFPFDASSRAPKSHSVESLDRSVFIPTQGRIESGHLNKGKSPDKPFSPFLAPGMVSVASKAATQARAHQHLVYARLFEIKPRSRSPPPV